MKITISKEGQNRSYAERIGVDYKIGQEVDIEVKGSIKQEKGGYEIIENGNPVSSDENGNAYIPLCEGTDAGYKKYGIFVSGGRNGSEYKLSAFLKL